MNEVTIRLKRKSIAYIEPVIHILLWLLLFSSINVSWNDPWFDTSLRPNHPSPLSVIFLPIYFYMHGFWLMPKFFDRTKWWKYILWTFIAFLTPEIIRVWITQLFSEQPWHGWLDAFQGRDSLILGSPSAAWFGFILSFIYRLVADTFINQNKLKAMQVSRTQSELDQLKAQINPHFLFNNLNTLDGLIDSDNEEARNYLSHLTRLYRFYLQQATLDIIPLRDEWEALSHYINLLEVRFGSAYQFNKSIEQETLESYFIPPATLQLVIENVVKHNIGDPNKPLTTSLYIQNDHMVIRNLKQPKIETAPKNHIGLDNIRKRLKLLTGKEIKITENDYFTVEIPLIKS